MKGLCCNSGLLSSYGVEEAINILAEESYQAIEISLEPEPPWLPRTPPHMRIQDDLPKRVRVRRSAEKAGVKIVAVNAHTNLIESVPDIRQAHLDFVRRSIQIAADLGALYVVTAPGRKTFYGYERQYWDWAISAYRDLVVEADRLDITLTVEAASLPGCLVRNLETIQKFLDQEGLERVGVIFDPAHYHVRGDDATETYRALHQRVVHVHAKDAKGHPEDFEFPRHWARARSTLRRCLAS